MYGKKNFETKKIFLIGGSAIFFIYFILPELGKKVFSGVTGGIFDSPVQNDTVKTDGTGVEIKDKVIVKKSEFPNVSVKYMGKILTHDFYSYRTDSENLYKDFGLDLGRFRAPWEDEESIIQTLRKHTKTSFFYLSKMYSSLYKRNLSSDCRRWLSENDLERLKHLDL